VTKVYVNSPRPQVRTNLERPICKRCGIKPCSSKGRSPNGGTQWSSLCWKCRQPTLTANRHYRKNALAKAKIKPDDFKCARCNFFPEHSAQMDLDHIDGNRHNNDPSNHQLLCANCHRLKTIQNGDHLKVYDYGLTEQGLCRSA
jgi:Zn finger protein HypA/HybF involved in hydrogenase expression